MFCFRLLKQGRALCPPVKTGKRSALVKRGMVRRGELACHPTVRIQEVIGALDKAG